MNNGVPKAAVELVRPMCATDLGAVSALDTLIQPSPWTQPQLEQAWQQAYRGWVITQQQQLWGFALSQQVLDEVSLLSLGVHPAMRNRGYGHALLAAVIEDALQHHALSIYLEVRASHRQAQHLYQRHGFKAMAQRKAYYRNPEEDAIIMHLLLAQPTPQ